MNYLWYQNGFTILIYVVLNKIPFHYRKTLQKISCLNRSNLSLHIIGKVYEDRDHNCHFTPFLFFLRYNDHKVEFLLILMKLLNFETVPGNLKLLLLRRIISHLHGKRNLSLLLL